MANIALISCVKKKLLYKAKVRDLYISTLFKKSLKYAENVLKPDKIYILSAKHCLLDLDKEIYPYEKTLNGMPKVEKQKWSMDVIEQLNSKCNIATDKFFILAGRNYYEYLIKLLPNYVIVMEKLNMFQRITWLKKELNER